MYYFSVWMANTFELETWTQLKCVFVIQVALIFHIITWCVYPLYWADISGPVFSDFNIARGYIMHHNKQKAWVWSCKSFSSIAAFSPHWVLQYPSAFDCAVCNALLIRTVSQHDRKMGKRRIIKRKILILNNLVIHSE